MTDFYAKIQRVLELEQQKGYLNSAVSGGLQNFLAYIENQKSSAHISDEEHHAIVQFFETYPQLRLTDRKVWIRDILRLITLDDPHPFFTFSNDQQAHKNIPARNLPPSGTLQDAALHAGIQAISGIGPRNAKLFEKLGVQSIYDLFRFYPRKYQDFSQLKTINQIIFGEEVTLTGIVMGEIVNRKSKKGNLNISEAILSDSTGNIQLTWFNQPFLKNQLHPGMAIVVSGKVDHFRGRFTMSSPVWEALEKEQIHTNRIVPIYPSTAGLSQRQIRNIVKKNIDFWAPKIREYLPYTIADKNGFSKISDAITQIHFPDSDELLKKSQKRFAFEEVFFLQLGVSYLKTCNQKAEARSFTYLPDRLAQRKRSLPYLLTSAQENAISMILQDIASKSPMNRLLQGDVGSGKTVVAKFAIEAIVDSGAQAVVLAPTSILAEQHFATLSALLETSGCLQNDEVALLLGKTTSRERAEILEKLKIGKIKCIIGTHALLEAEVDFQDLQLVVIDEQHRFGVKQRDTLRGKGNNPHTLVMSATPIPRSLAITLFGDLDVTTINEMPPGRLPVTTTIIQGKEREKAYDLVRNQLNNGFQAFIVYPLIEDEEGNEEKSAVANNERLQKDVFAEYNVGLLHGKMKPAEKEQTMREFRDGKFDILVSTTVIEVGVDIPGATVMIIESANFFGLAQLHQLRGRVGRNAELSHCILIPDNDDTGENKRLQAMVETNDGFRLADIDLEMRGPGEFLGTRQSGYIGFEFASLTDTKLIEKCHESVHNIIMNDPLLIHPDHLLLREELSNRWPGVIERYERFEEKDG
jgi:ATP-dependent DNA helicase RecG